MLDLIDKGEPHEAHPVFWAPFVLVGEGALGDAWPKKGGRDSHPAMVVVCSGFIA
jgi:hypothetical protein